MATERQIAANRANAKKSTGPKTAAGKLRSSRNAYRHGLSSPLWLDSLASAKADAIARALLGEDPTAAKLRSVEELVRAQLDLQRIRSTRTDLMAKFDLDQPDIQTLQRMAALDRYERYVHTRRRRAGAKF